MATQKYILIFAAIQCPHSDMVCKQTAVGCVKCLREISKAGIDDLSIESSAPGISEDANSTEIVTDLLDRIVNEGSECSIVAWKFEDYGENGES